MRTIWVSIRAINYTDQATRQVGRNISELQRKEQELRTESVKLMMAGVMWTTFAALAIVAISKIMEKSAEGRLALNQFERSMNKMLDSLGTAFAKVLGPMMKMLSGFFDIIAKYPAIANLIAVLATLVITCVALKGITMAVTGAVQYLGLAHLFQAQATAKVVQTQLFAAASTHTLSGAFMQLKASLGPALAMFMVFFQIGTMIGQYAPVLLGVIAALTVAMWAYAAANWSAATAMSILTFGAAAAIGVGASIAASASAPTYQTGVRAVRKTGMVIAHEGEEIRSKRNVMYNQGSNGRPETRMFYFTFSGDIHTKADKEELKPLILKTMRDAMDNRT